VEFGDIQNKREKIRAKIFKKQINQSINQMMAISKPD
jgi:hypothetical protein